VTVESKTVFIGRMGQHFATAREAELSFLLKKIEDLMGDQETPEYAWERFSPHTAAKSLINRRAELIALFEEWDAKEGSRDG
jgi:hypothetical protein